MTDRDRAHKDWLKGMKRKAIAQKYGISENTVKSWISRYWKNDAVKDKGAKPQKAPPKKKGAPKGNKNAKGSGCPRNNSNALKHGGYSQVYWDTLSEEEKELIDTIPKDEETLLIDQIKLYSVRERRLLLAINKLKSEKGNIYFVSSSRSEKKRQFAKKEDKKIYDEMVDQDIADGKRKPGEVYELFTATENKENAIARLEMELTKVQNAKTKAIATLAKYNAEKAHLNLEKESKSVGNNAVDDWIAAVIDSEYERPVNDEQQDEI